MDAEEAVILLAGGKSSRLGQPKGLVPVRGLPWIEHQLRDLAEVGAREVILVLGFQAGLYGRALPWLERALQPAGEERSGLRVRAVINGQPEQGPFTSVQAAGQARPELEHYWILPIDVPCPASAVWARLSASNSPASVPLHEGRGGHPVRISRDFMTRLLQLPPDGPDSRLDHQLRALGPAVARLETGDPGILKNLNLPRDWT